MAADLKQYDDWVIKNQKDVLDWVKMYSTKSYDNVKKAFENYHRAKSKWQQIDAFEGIKESLKNPEGVKFTNRINERFLPARERLQRTADKYTDGDIDALWIKYSSNKDMETYDRYKNLYKSLSTIPEKADKYENLELDRAYQDNYDYKAMKALAEKYNYDYTDKKDRNEFLKHLSEIEKQRLKAEAYTPKDVRGMVTQMAYPVSVEHARKYDEITPGSVFADNLGIAAMAGGAGALGEKIGGQGLRMASDILAAPVVTEAGQILSNDKDLGDAAKDALVMAGTNILAPGMIKGYGATFTTPLKKSGQQGAKAAANTIADEAEQIIRAKNNGVPYRNVPDLKKRATEIFREKIKNPGDKNYDQLLKESLEQAENEWKIATNIKLNAEGKTGVYKKDFLGRKVELTPEEVNMQENNILNITPEDRKKEQLFWKWNKSKLNPRRQKMDPVTKSMGERNYATKVINNENITTDDLIAGGYQENPLHMINRYLGRMSDNSFGRPLKSLGTNLGATTRLTDRKIGMANRYFNLPWNYGDSEKEIDLEDPRIKAYLEAYGRYKGNKDYFTEPPKPKNMSDDDIRKLQELAKKISIMDIFGE